MSVTIVTAFFDIGREKADNRKVEDYLGWLKKTLKLNCNLYVVTEPKFEEFFRQNRTSNVEYNIIDFKESHYYKYNDDISKIIESYDYQTKMMHPGRVECKLPGHIIVNYSKFHYLEMAMTSNPFNTDYFYWLDAGSSRFFSDVDISKPFPSRVFSDDKFVIQRRHDLHTFKIDETFTWRSDNLLIGTMFGGKPQIIRKISTLLEEEFNTMIQNKSVNNEQVGLAIVWNNNKDLFKTIGNEYSPEHLGMFKMMSSDNDKFCSFQNYEINMRLPYNPNRSIVDMDVGFFAMCSYQKTAWEATFASIRAHYPGAPIILINDGFDQYDYTDMAKRYNCIYVAKDKEICLYWPDVWGAYEFLERFKEACDLAKTEWMINLHPDVICNGKIKYRPDAAIAGVNWGESSAISCNPWDPKLVEYIRKYNNSVENIGFGWCGGGILHVPTFYKIYDAKFSIEDIAEVNKQTSMGEDMLMPCLFMLGGYNYRLWQECCQWPRSWSGVFLHNIKEYYDFKQTGISQTDFYNKCIDEWKAKWNTYSP
jgi:hypothetical protein